MQTTVPCRSEAPHRPTHQRLRAAVIGLGVGAAHAEACRDHPACELVALCDHSEKALARAGQTYRNVELSTSADDVLDDPDVDVVCIASYDEDHYEQVARAIINGKHVFVEKPLCMRVSEARHIRELLAERPRLRLSSNLILRLCPRFTSVKARISRGDFGDLFLVDGDYHYGRIEKITRGWRGRSDYYSVVLGGAIHIVDLLMWLTGGRIVAVGAFGNGIASRGSQFRFNDVVISTLQFENGIVGKAGVSFGCMRPHFHGLAVYGTKATFVNGVPHGVVYASRDPRVAPVPVTDAYPGVHKGALLVDFLDAIVSGRRPIVDQDDVFRSLSVCLAIEQSARLGTTCRVEELSCEA